MCCFLKIEVSFCLRLLCFSLGILFFLGSVIMAFAFVCSPYRVVLLRLMIFIISIRFDLIFRHSSWVFPGRKGPRFCTGVAGGTVIKYCQVRGENITINQRAEYVYTRPLKDFRGTIRIMRLFRFRVWSVHSIYVIFLSFVTNPNGVR